MSVKRRGPRHKLLRNLTRELFQTEVSASRHCRREAARYPDTPPALALLAVANHADEALAALPAIAKRAKLPVSGPSMLVGAAFSRIRESITDRVLQGERSYRATLLGVRHGVDLVRMVGHVAAWSEQPELLRWTAVWTSRRASLVLELEQQLSWFAAHVEEASHAQGGRDATTNAAHADARD